MHTSKVDRPNLGYKRVQIVVLYLDLPVLFFFFRKLGVYFTSSECKLVFKTKTQLEQSGLLSSIQSLHIFTVDAWDIKKKKARW